MGKLIDMNGGNGSELPPTKLDPTKLETLKCSNCDGIFFEEVTLFKRVPAMQSPNGQKSMLPIPMIICKQCGQPHEDLSPINLI